VAGESPSGGGPPGLQAELGPRLWGPPRELEARAARERRTDRTRALLLYAGALAAVVGAAVTAAPGSYGSSTGLSAAGGLLALAGTWLLYRAGRHEGVSLGVFEGGVLLPSSFESVPGLSTMGGPVFIRREEVDRVEDMRSGEDRAIVVWSKAGRSGLLSGRLEGGTMTPAKSGAILDDFSAALRRWAPDLPIRAGRKADEEE